MGAVKETDGRKVRGQGPEARDAVAAKFLVLLESASLGLGAKPLAIH